MSEPAIQDYYPEDFSHCFGCGRMNEQGHQIKTRWEGDGTVAHFHPEPFHTALPGFVYGGLIASLVDCHGTGTAALASYRAEGRALDTEPPLRFVTGSLHVDFLKPTPMGPLELRGTVETLGPRKVVVLIDVLAGGDVTARGRVVAVRMPDSMARRQTAQPAEAG